MTLLNGPGPYNKFRSLSYVAQEAKETEEHHATSATNNTDHPNEDQSQRRTGGGARRGVWCAPSDESGLGAAVGGGRLRVDDGECPVAAPNAPHHGHRHQDGRQDKSTKDNLPSSIPCGVHSLDSGNSIDDSNTLLEIRRNTRIVTATVTTLQ